MSGRGSKQGDSSRAIRLWKIFIAALLFLAASVFWLFGRAESEVRVVRLIPLAKEGGVTARLLCSPWVKGEARDSSGLLPLFSENFEGTSLEPRWRVCTSEVEFGLLGEMSQAKKEVLRAPRLYREGANQLLRFETPVGLVWTSLAVQPDTPYELRARVGGAVLEADGSESYRACVVIVELHEAFDLGSERSKPLHQAVSSATVVDSHVLSRKGPGRELGEARLVFKTTPHTRSIVLGALAGLPVDTRKGVVTFDDITLTQWPLRRFMQQESDRTPSSGRDECRFTRIELAGDSREGLWLPPPAELTFKLEIPAPRPRLEFAYGILEENLLGRSEATAELRLTVRSSSGERDGLQTSLRAGDDSSGPGWQEAHLDLSAFEGETIELHFETRGADRDAMVAIGAPIIRTRVSATARRPSVILVSLDTLRADHLGLYGYERETSPFMDEFFSEEGAFLSSLVAASPFTLPSHASIFTGQYPSVHGVEQYDRRMDPRVNPHLAEILSRGGYVTAAFTGGKLLRREYGFWRGFDIYSQLDPLMDDDNAYRDLYPRVGQRAFNDRAYARYGLDRVLDFISDHRDGPFFLFLHTYAIHDYTPPKELARRFDEGCTSTLGDRFSLREIELDPERRRSFSAEDLAHIRNYYDATIRAADDALARLVERLRKEDLLDDSVLIVLSDHGEEFLDHGGFLHAQTLYREMLHVPLLMRVPGMAISGRIEGKGHHVDIAPTILDAVDLPVDERMQGQSLLPLLVGAELPPSLLLSELNADGFGEKQALEVGRFKLIETRSLDRVAPRLRFRGVEGSELYDILDDPLEEAPLSDAFADELVRMQEQLRRLRDRFSAARRELGAKEINRFVPSVKIQRELREIGYMGSPGEVVR